MTKKLIDFNYCIWFVPENTEFLKKFTNGFIPHMTIFSKLDYHVAFSKFNELKKIFILLMLKEILNYLLV